MLEDEETMLACILLDQSIIFKTTLTEDHFQDPYARRMFRAMNECCNRDVKIDYISITDIDPKIDKTYAPRLNDMIPSAANWKYYEGKVKDDWQRSKLASIGRMLLSIDKYTCPSEYIERAEKELVELATNNKKREIRKLNQILPQTLKEIETRYALKGKLPGLSTGIDPLDVMIGGLRGDQYIVIGARPSDGKSALGLNIACHIAIDEKVPVGFISAESSEIEITFRIFSARGNINGTKLNSGMLSPQCLNDIMFAGEKMHCAPMYIYDEPNIKFSEIKSISRQMVSVHGCKIIFVDYVQIVQWENQKLARHEQVAEISMGLKQLARELKVPIVAMSQLRRDAEGRRPHMADLDYSKQLEQDADVLIFIYHPQKDGEYLDQSELIVAKQRGGPKGTVPVIFKREFVKFCPVERSDFS